MVSIITQSLYFFQVNRNYVFEDEEAHLPRNLVVVDQMSLVVRTVRTVQKKPQNTTTKNFKKFRKVCTKSSGSSSNQTETSYFNLLHPCLSTRLNHSVMFDTST